MVSKATATKGSSQAFDYLLDDKGHAQELDRNLITGENGQELLAEIQRGAGTEHQFALIILIPLC
jgi:hypothetical protein